MAKDREKNADAAPATPAAPTTFKVVMRRDLAVGGEVIPAGTVIGELKLTHAAVTTNILFDAVHYDFATTE